MQQITARHKRIVDRVHDAATCRWHVYSENRPVGSDALRPDLTLIKDREALIIDTTVTFENGKATFATARHNKERKYAKMTGELKGRFNNVRFEAIVVGALGSWKPRNDSDL